ncbi:MAG: cytochrome c maturation protein CcmE [Dehalococcoidia bacterium]|nr:cytochrome c maturation protein CcmE [Dehalococcoidia bacterium]
MKKKKFIIAGGILLGAFVFLGVYIAQNPDVFFQKEYTVSQLNGLVAAQDGTSLRVMGKLASFARDAGNSLLVRFVLTENEQNLSVVYKGALPDLFVVGNDVGVVGKFDSTGIFQAKTIITKCPSKYEPAKQ